MNNGKFLCWISCRKMAACFAAAVFAVLFSGCASNSYLTARRGTSVVDGMPDAQQLDSLTRHRMTVGAEECYALLFDLLQREGCLIESADKSSGLIVARQVLTQEPVAHQRGAAHGLRLAPVVSGRGVGLHDRGAGALDRPGDLPRMVRETRPRGAAVGTAPVPGGRGDASGRPAGPTPAQGGR